MWPIRETIARTILTPTTGFLEEAGFTHSLSPARNCTYGCTYCYVPTMGFYGGLKPEDSQRWGQFTTLKVNAAELASRARAAGRVIYCSPLVDPYQPAERERPIMPGILEAIGRNPPDTFVIQTRGPLILRDLALLEELASRTRLRISFSITTDRDEVRRRYESRCESNEVRLAAICRLRQAGLEVYSTIAPILPCDPERLVRLAIEASKRDVIADALHIRSTKARGATSRDVSLEIARRYGEDSWFDASFQHQVLRRMEQVTTEAGYRFASGPRGFGQLAKR